MKARFANLGRIAHVVLFVVVGVLGFVVALAAVDMAFAVWGQPCDCIQGRYTLCTSTCISVGGLEINEAWKPVFALLSGFAADAILEACVFRADNP